MTDYKREIRRGRGLEPMTKPTPGQAARAVPYSLQDALDKADGKNCLIRQKDALSILAKEVRTLQAAIDAARPEQHVQTVDAPVPTLNDAIGKCFGFDAARPASTEDEREHKVFVFAPLATYNNGNVIMTPAEFEAHVQRERAAARAEGEAKAKLEAAQEAVQAQYVINMVEAELTALQQKYDALAAAARDLVDHIERKYYHLVAPSPKAAQLHGELGRRACVVFAALAQQQPREDT